MLCLALVNLCFYTAAQRLIKKNAIELEINIKSFMNSWAINAEESFFNLAKRETLTTIFLSDVELVTKAFSRITCVLIPDIIHFCCAVATVFTISIKVGIITLVGSVIPMLLLGLLAKRVTDLQQKYQQSVESIHGLISQATYHLETVWAYSIEEGFLKSMLDLQNISLRRRKEVERRLLVINVPTTILSLITYIIVLIASCLEIQAGNMKYDSLFIIIMLVDHVVDPVSQIEGSIAVIKQGQAGLHRVMNLDQDFENSSKRIQKNIKTNRELFEIPDSIDSLQVSNLSVTYPNGYHIEYDETFSFTKGTINYLTSRNGTGKSTLCNILKGVYSPDGGKLCINGLPAPSIDCLKDYISVSIQDAEMLDGTILDNLVLGNKNATNAQVEGLCEKYDILREINGFPLQFNTLVSNAGDSLSKGQRQRLNIVRALLKDVPVYFFDEPTEFLDDAHRQIVWTNIKELSKDRIVIIATHDRKNF